jgi:hypothetical protein
MIYLAIPYSHPDPDVRENRFLIANRVAAMLFKSGEHVFSPISHSHPIKMAGELPGGFDFWEKYDRCMIEMCKELLVVQCDGWEESVGVTAEIEIARSLGIPVRFVDPAVALCPG